MTTNGTLTTLASFANSNGANPRAGLVQGSDGDFYGTAANGGMYGINGADSGGYGTIFRVATNGVLTSLYSFTGGNDGANPQAGLVQSRDGNFYGTAANGGSGGYGTVFMLTTNGTLTTFASFANTNGANPYAGVIQGSDGNIYGTTWSAGQYGYGTVFMMTTNGTLNTLVSFANTNGANPNAGVIQGERQFLWNHREWWHEWKLRDGIHGDDKRNPYDIGFLCWHKWCKSLRRSVSGQRRQFPWNNGGWGH